jgi:hypothetical protein
LDPLIAQEQGFVGLSDLTEWQVSALNNMFTFKKVKDGFDPMTVVLDMEPIREKEKDTVEHKEAPEDTPETPTPPPYIASTDKNKRSRKNKEPDSNFTYSRKQTAKRL